MPACPSCQWEILKAISPEITLRLKRKNKDCGRCIGRWMGCKEVIITVWHWSMRKHLYTQYYKEISTGMWCMPTSIAPEAVIAAAGTGSLARSTVRHSVSLIIKSLLLPAAEHAHLLSLSAESKDSHICMTRSFARMTGFEGRNFLNKITLNICMLKK